MEIINAEALKKPLRYFAGDAVSPIPTKAYPVLSNLFPLDVFPSEIQDIINDTNRTLLFPIDFIGSAILYAISVAVGNTHIAQVKNGWTENAVIYMALVGRAGTNKSHPITFTLKPIEKKDSEKFSDFTVKNAEYELAKNLSKKERIEQGQDEPVKPIWEQHLVTDFTPEALADIMKNNPRGIGVYVDELPSWFKNFNRYSKGSEEQFWLSNWSGKAMRINRKSSPPIYIPKPFISVAGTIQPGVLTELASNRQENGFLDRILFAIPDDLKKEYWSEEELSYHTSEKWDCILNRLLDLEIKINETGGIEQTILKLSPEAKKALLAYQRTTTDRANQASEETAGIYAKIEMYAVRLALILEMVFFACGEGNKEDISERAVTGAIRLCEYFINTADKVHTVITASPYERLPKNKQEVYDALPSHFTTSEGAEYARQLGMPERTFRRFLTETDIFQRTSYGEYGKRL